MKHEKEGSQEGWAISINREYDRCLTALSRAGILSALSVSQEKGVIGSDGLEYPLPTREQVTDLFADNRELVTAKIPQGFDRLEMTPLAMSTPNLMDLLTTAIIRHDEQGCIFQTRRSPEDPFVPVRVNKERRVWIWDVLRQRLDTDEIKYFPKEHSTDHQGLTKMQMINSRRICAIPGWSIGLVESLPIMPAPGRGLIIEGRRQLEIGSSPREYLETLRSRPYRGETGITLEDFLTKFLTKLEMTNEVSNDVDDDNAIWCLGQYYKLPYADVVPAGRWIRQLGRLRLDSHRTGNKKCTKRVGATTMVRFVRH